MFISTVRLKGQPGKRKEILQTIDGVLVQIKLKKGCLGVASYQDINDENIFFIVDEWRTEKDLDEYLHSSLFSVLLGIQPMLREVPEVKISFADGSCRFEGEAEKGLSSPYHNGAG